MAHIIKCEDCQKQHPDTCFFHVFKNECEYPCTAATCGQCENHCPCCLGPSQGYCRTCNESNCDNRTEPFSLGE